MSTYKKEIKYTYVFLKCIQLLKDATEIFLNIHILIKKQDYLE